MTTDDSTIEQPSQASPYDATTRFVFSHTGLAAVDPWEAERRPLRETIWPWGLRGLAETLEVIALAMIMFMAVRSVAHNYRVDGSSMVPSFHDGEALIVNRMAYRTLDLGWLPVVGRDHWQPFGAFQQGDVVIFIAQKAPKERDFVKRVIALPGQTVEVRDGHVRINGVAYEEPYISAPPTYNFPAQLVPPGKLFVLGDNRNNSQDSHVIGMVDQSEVVGRVDLRYWPLNAAGVIRREFGTPVTAASLPFPGDVVPSMVASSTVASSTVPGSTRLQSEVSLFP